VIVDVHAHHHPRPFLDALIDVIGPRRRAAFDGAVDTDAAASVQQRLAMMDEAGVAVQVLSPMAGLAPYLVEAAAATRAAAAVNDAYAELVRRHPERFRAFVSLPLPHLDPSLAELARGFDELGMIGVNLHISVLDRSVADPAFRPIYEEVNRRKGVIFYHPCGNSICSPMIAEHGFAAAVGTSLEDAVIALHLIAGRLPAQFPDITFIIPHLGGPIPMLLERLDNQFPMQARGLPEPPSATARRFYYDTVGHGSRAALTCAWLAFGAEHLLCGSDFPVLNRHEPYERTINWVADAGLPAEAVQRILHGTAPAILPGLPPVGDGPAVGDRPAPSESRPTPARPDRG
jgi:predicted TIM-barrel fold metal-dependent hydrolase